MVDESKSHILQHINVLNDYILRGGPVEAEWKSFDNYIDLMALQVTNKEIDDDDLRGFRKYLLSIFDSRCLQGFILCKPYGYAGDFEIIDKIHTNYISNIPAYINWDKYFQNSSAPKAVRNRKEYLKRIVRPYLGDSLHMLNVGSGPCRDIFELLEERHTGDIEIHCVDMDIQAIHYAKNLTRDYEEKVKFFQTNIFRFESKSQYNIIWSAGLFDYLDDKAFVFLLKRFVSWCTVPGEIIVGNFSNHNPSRNYMEIFGEWYLQHRSEDQLTSLALSAGLPLQNVFVGQEAEGVNLFLHIKL